MGEQDSTEKVLEDYNDVFADIVNGLLFYGKEIIHEDQLVNTKDKLEFPQFYPHLLIFAVLFINNIQKITKI